MRSWMVVASVAVFSGIAAGNVGCGTVETTGSGAAGGTGGTGGTGGSGGAGGTGGGGAGGAMCPADPGDAPCGGGLQENDGLRCEYDTKPCPTILACSSSATHGGWLTRPPEKDSACEAAGEVCTYVDENFDSGQTTTWTATCSPEKTWTVEEMTESSGP